MNTTMNVQVVDLSPIHVVMLKHMGPYEQMDKVCEQLWDWVGKNSVPAQRTIGIYWDNPEFTPAAKLRGAACIEVPAGFQPISTGGLLLSVEDIAGGSYATTRYVGPYEGLAAVWSSFTNQIEGSLGKQIREKDPAFEIYVNDASDTPAAQLITELYMPLV